MISGSRRQHSKAKALPYNSYDISFRKLIERKRIRRLTKMVKKDLDLIPLDEIISEQLNFNKVCTLYL
jgi:hypothetical protein